MRNLRLADRAVRLFCASAMLTAVLFTTARSIEPGKTSLLVMFVKPRAPEHAIAARAARAGLMRVLEKLEFRKLYSPDDLANDMKVEEFRKKMEDNSTGNLMELGRKAGADKVVYCEIDEADGKRTLWISLLPSKPKGPIRYSKAVYPVKAVDEEIDLEIGKALVELLEL